MILAIDTSGGRSVAVLSSDGVLLASRSDAAERSHAELLAPMVQGALADAGVDVSALTAVAVGTGPAPFTGLRVGLVTAAVLGETLGVPVLGVPSLDALAVPHRGHEVLVVTDAKRKEVYFARYAPSGEVTEGPGVARPAGLAVGDARVVGTTVFAELGAEAAAVDGAEIGRLALERAAAGLDQPATPLYLRRPDAVPSVAKPIVDASELALDLADQDAIRREQEASDAR